MSSAGKRSWKCPECGNEVMLSMTQLDPIACPACIEKMKGGGSAATGTGLSSVAAGPLAIWQGLPEMTKLAIVAGALVVGLVIGFIAGKSMVPPEAASHRATSKATESEGSHHTEVEEERPEAPGPGYKWVRGRERKDGTRGPGHWAKDPFYKGKDEPSEKSKKE